MRHLVALRFAIWTLLFLPVNLFSGETPLTVDQILQGPVLPFSDEKRREAERWIAELNHDSFEHRDNARAGLIALGSAAKPYIQTQLDKETRRPSPNPEAVSTFRIVLAAIDRQGLDGKRERIRQNLQRIFDAAPALNAPPTGEALEGMKKRISFEFVDNSLGKCIKEISLHTGVPIIIDPNAIAGAEPSINLRVTDMRSCDALSWVLRLAELEMVEYDDVVIVAKPEIAQKVSLYRRSLPLPVEPGEAQWTMEETQAFADLFRVVDQVARPGNKDEAFPFQVEATDAGAITVTAIVDRRSDVMSLINRLKNFEADQVNLLDEASERRLKDKLSFDWNETPSGKVFETLQEKANGVTLIVKVPLDVPCTLKGDSVSISDTLLRIAEQKGWGIRPVGMSALLIEHRADDFDTRKAFSLDLRPMLKAGVSQASIEKVLEKVSAEAPQPMVAKVVRGRWLGMADEYSVQRVRNLVERAVKSGTLPELSAAPWFLNTLKPFNRQEP